MADVASCKNTILSATFNREAIEIVIFFSSVISIEAKKGDFN